LKTPLAVIGTQLDDESVDLDSLRDTVDQMRVRVRSELDRALRSGRRTMRALVGIRPVLARAIRTLEKLYREVVFELEVAEGLAANVDERDLLELVGNLAENAAKYGARRVRVEATQGTASLRRRGVRISVDDNGPGMSPDEFDRMLQRGVRGDQREQQQVEGQGLGLAIVERIVSGYSGSVRAASSSLGGLCVVIDLPPEARSAAAKEPE
jgi:two-component system sensor histidine kinase PhoQ